MKQNRRSFLKTGGVAALSAAAALKLGGMHAAYAQGGLTGDITMIKGPHSANEFKFEAMIIDDFKSVEPAVNVEFTTYDWSNMNAQLTTGFASGNPADVLYLVSC